MEEKLSPMMIQYLRLKETYKDCLLFFRLGDFYELFFEDAKTASNELSLTLTGRNCGLKERAPMCGVPYHSVNSYINRLIEKGYKIAICEQLSDPKDSKGMVERDVVRVITPGTVIEDNILVENANNFIVSLFMTDRRIGIAYSDVSTGAFYVSEFSGKYMANELCDELYRINPREIIASGAVLKNEIVDKRIKPYYYIEEYSEWTYELKKAKSILKKHFGEQSLVVLIDNVYALCAAGALLYYLDETQKNALLHIDAIKLINKNEYMFLDEFTRANLELTKPMRSDGSKRNTLLGILDKTKTPMGARTLRIFIDQPLLVKTNILSRLDAVEELLSDKIMSDKIASAFKTVHDIERLCAKIAYSNINARDCCALRESLFSLPLIKLSLGNAKSAILVKARDNIDALEDISELLDRAISDDAPITIKDGGIIKSGFDENIDKFRDIQKNTMGFLANMEAEERTATGIKNLKIGYNRVFGYYIEVGRSSSDSVPYRYERKQTLSNAERYVTKELKELENNILTASEQCIDLEYNLFCSIKNTLLEAMSRMKETAAIIGDLDAYLSLSVVAEENGYVRPEINEEGVLEIIDGRHPVVEKSLNGDFIANNTIMDFNENRLLILTGPNMAGKSTYLRQTALIVLMAQVGSFVPARRANICITDRIFTRVGASDNLATGQSTFMVEMSEMASILNCATQNSLLILDEIGRGTSTYDGLSIAWATLEYIADIKKCGAKTLFATHYHELTEFENRLDGVKNYKILVKEVNDTVVFLRKIARGSADKSFGIEVAKLAGLPKAIIDRAKTVLAALEEADINKQSIRNINMDAVLDSGKKTEVEEKISGIVKGLDLNNMTPLEAMAMLGTIKTIIWNED
ncbi:MAG: DNA mismatch repair protein MutS [Clostridia bacterium]